MKYVRDGIKKYSVCLVILLIFLIGLKGGGYNFKAPFLMRQITIMILLSIGMGIEIISGDFDLAFASQLSVSTLTAVFVINGGGSVWVACLLIVGQNMILGCLKGWLLVKLKMPSIIFTLALQVILSNIFSAFIPDIAVMIDETKRILPSKMWVPGLVCILFAAIGAAAFFLKHTYYGRYCRMLGENMELMEKNGLKCTEISMVIHSAASLFFSAAAILILCYTNSGSAGLGESYLFKVMMAVFLGGIEYKNGRGNLFGMVIGAVTVTLIMSLLTGNGYLNKWETILEGLVILLTLAVQGRSHFKKN